MKNDFLQNVIHWLLVTIGFLSALSGFGWIIHLVPGRVGLVLGGLWVLIGSTERLLILLEKVLAGKVQPADAAHEFAKDVQEVSADVSAVAKAAEPFIKNAPK